jgi:DNA repair protein RadD
LAGGENVKLQDREYQARSVRDLRRLLKDGKRVVAVGPTGCGKTHIATMLIAAERRWRVLFVVHRYELADQAWRSLTSNGITAGIVMAQEETLRGAHRVDPAARVQVASVQTLSRRVGPEHVDLIIFDEAHRVMADSYQAVARAYPEAHVLGLTWTPERTDGKGLGEFFDEMHIIAQPSELHESRHLSDPRWFGAPAGYRAKLKERLRGMRVSGGDYMPADLERAVDNRYLMGNVVSETLRLAPDRSKVVFAGSVLHSQKLAAAFRRKGVKAVHLDGETPAAEREQMLVDLREGRLEMICNYDVLSEGWDLPDLGAVVLARPFRSLTRYLQCVGRGMRWRRGPRPIALDFGDNAPRFKLWPGDDVPWSIDGKERASREPLWKQCEGCQERIPLAATVCPECGHACPIERARREREEADAELQEATRAEYMATRGRVEAMAKKKGAPAGWVEKVMEEIAA